MKMSLCSFSEINNSCFSSKDSDKLLKSNSDFEQAKWLDALFSTGSIARISC